MHEDGLGRIRGERLVGGHMMFDLFNWTHGYFTYRRISSEAGGLLDFNMAIKTKSSFVPL
jgi:hypothetical protein